MCCSHGFISRMPTTPPPLVSPRTHFPVSPSIRLPLTTTTGGSRSCRTKSVKDSGASIKDELSFYELLGLSDTVTYVEIKQAYKQLARKYHPDVSPPGRVEEYTRKFIRVQEAYETLSDPDRRAVYDRDMAMGIHFAFTSRTQLRNQEKMEKGEWRGQWQSQLSELRKRSTNKETGSNMSWAARMRKERKQSSS